MAKIVVTGGGLIGLSTAMLLADDGHEVTVLERDPGGPPAVAADAWTGWERRGVNQFRMIHFFLPRFRLLMEKELPRVIEAFDAAGALRLNPIKGAPDELTGGFRAEDEMFEAVTARRPVGETAVATVAQSTPGVTLRRGVAVVGVVTGTPVTPGVPHVTGVLTESGEEIRADLVVDATGRRSPLPTWLADAGARPPDEELDDCGFIYYGRHFRSADGSVPPALGGLLQHYDSVSLLTLPADNGTWGIGVITSAKDPTLRALRDNDTWTATVRSYPLIAHWLDGEPIDEQVAVMAKIEDRHRDFCIDGTPVATGIVAVADSWACTNPSVGRGISIGVLHAIALRDLVRTHDLSDPLGFAKEWHDVTNATVEPFFQATLEFDRHRLAEIDAQIAGVPYAPDDPGWKLGRCLEAGAVADPELLRGFLKIVALNATPEEVFAGSGMIERALRVGGPLKDQPAPGPSRAELLATVGG